MRTLATQRLSVTAPLLVILCLLIGLSGCGTGTIGPASFENANSDYASAFSKSFKTGDSPRYIFTLVTSENELKGLTQIPGAFHIGIYDSGTGSPAVSIAYVVGPVGSGATIERGSVISGSVDVKKEMTVKVSSDTGKDRANTVISAVVVVLADIEK